MQGSIEYLLNEVSSDYICTSVAAGRLDGASHPRVSNWKAEVLASFHWVIYTRQYVSESSHSFVVWFAVKQNFRDLRCIIRAIVLFLVTNHPH